MGMVWSMLINLTILVSLWMYDLKTVMYLLNRVPSKTVLKIPFELWTNMTPASLELPGRNKDL